MMLNCIWWWGFSSGNLVSVEYSFTPRTNKYVLKLWVFNRKTRNYITVCKQIIIMIVIIIRLELFSLVPLFNDISTFVGYLMPKLSLLKASRGTF